MPPETGRIRVFKASWILTGAVFLAALVCLTFTSTHKTPEKFVWLAPDQLAHSLKPGILTQLKYKVLRWPGPWRWFEGNKTRILVESTLLAVSSGNSLQVEHSILCQTNSEGARVWVVSSEELLPLKEQCKGSPAVEERSSMRLTTFDGGQGRIACGTSVAVGSQALFSGLTADILPKLLNDSCKLLLGVTSTEPLLSTNFAVRTNISFSCRALVPNGGALVVDAGNSAPAAGTNYWLIISPTAVDAKGNPIKLKR